MPTQKAIAEHLGMSQPAVSQQLAPLGIDWKTATMESIRLAYIEHLRAVAAGHRSTDGFDLARERAMTEQVDRELKQITLAEKKGQVVNLVQLEPELVRMVVAFRTELLARDDKLKAEIDALYGIDLDLAYINEHTRNALAQLARYDPGHPGSIGAPGAGGGTAGGHDDHGVGKGAPEVVG
jgi:DNA-binding transcriptional ArsR family regulator